MARHSVLYFPLTHSLAGGVAAEGKLLEWLRRLVSCIKLWIGLWMKSCCKCKTSNTEKQKRKLKRRQQQQRKTVCETIQFARPRVGEMPQVGGDSNATNPSQGKADVATSGSCCTHIALRNSNAHKHTRLIAHLIAPSITSSPLAGQTSDFYLFVCVIIIIVFPSFSLSLSFRLYPL